MASTKPNQIVITGAVLMIAGSLLPWADVSSGLIGKITVAGSQGDGMITLVIGALLLILGLTEKGKPGKRYSSAGAILALIAALVSGYDLLSLLKVVVASWSTSSGVSVGIGLVLTPLASLFSMVGALARTPEVPGQDQRADPMVTVEPVSSPDVSEPPSGAPEPALARPEPPPEVPEPSLVVTEEPEPARRTSPGLIALLILVIGGAIYIAAINSPAPTRPRPARTPTAVPTDVPTGYFAEYSSGGLGVSREEWESRYDEGHVSVGGFSYDGDRYWVIFAGENVQHLEVRLSQGAVSLEHARKRAAEWIPRDSEFVRTYAPADLPELTVDVYTSRSLCDRFTGEWWFGDEPGTFIVIYSIFGDGSSFIIGTGDNQ